jgi:hypothetical protein
VADRFDCPPEPGEPVVDGHGWAYCDTCKVSVPVRDQFDDEVGYEEQARPVRVIELDCEHDIVIPLKVWPT